MKLKFEQPYKSIGEEIQKDLKDLDFPDFSIITGTNGSGKTHLLEAIKNESIKVDSTNPIVYFNYENFQFNNSDVLHYEPYRSMVDNLITMVGILNEEGYNITSNSAICRFISNVIQEIEQIQDNNTKDRKEITKQIVGAFLMATLSNDSTNKQKYHKEEVDNIYNIIDKFLNDIDYIMAERRNRKEYISIIRNYISSTHTGIGEKIYSIIKGYFLKEEEYLKSLNLGDQQNSNIDVKKLKEDFVKINGENPFKNFNLILEKIGCDSHLFEGYSLFDKHIESIKNRADLGIEAIAYWYGYEPILLNKRDKNVRVPINDLSSGEQTLLGVATLIFEQQQKYGSNFTLLLDETDTNLHPSMVEKLIEMIQGFIKDYNLKVFLVTHSPTTIALAPDNAGIFVMHRPNEKDKPRIAEVSKSEALGVLTEGYVSLSHENADLGIAYNISQTKLPVLFVEGITDKIILETAWQKLFPNKKINFYIQDCFGANFLSQMFSTKDGDLFTKYKNRKMIALFDFDEAYNQWNSLRKNNFCDNETDTRKCLCMKHQQQDKYALLLPVPNNDIRNQVLDKQGQHFGKDAKLSIEMLFYGTSIDATYFQQKDTVGEGQVIELRKNKQKFASDVKQLDQKDFVNFKPLFDKIDGIIDNKK